MEQAADVEPQVAVRESPRTWKEYVESHLMKAGTPLTAAAAIGPAGFAWAQSDDFPTIGADEYNSIMEEFNQHGALVDGLTFAGITYMHIEHLGPDVIKATVDERSNTGITIFRLGFPLIVGLYTENPEQCSKIVQELGTHIMNNQ